MEFEKALPYSIDLVIPGYERSYPPGVFKCLSFSLKLSRLWYAEFIEVLLGAIGKKFLPLYRMGDGEYEFCVGFRPKLRMTGEPIFHYWYHRLRFSVHRLRNWRPGVGINLKPGRGLNWQSGSYSTNEMAQLRNRYIEQVREIGKTGILSLVLSYRHTQFAQQYFLPITRWFRDENIPLNESNYFPVYFIYALLNGPERHHFFGGRRILVVTSLTAEKQNAILRSLEREGVKEVQFISISPNRSMYDKISLNSIHTPVDIALVAAGIGSSNILLQLAPLNTLTMDVGYVIECLANPELRAADLLLA